MTTAAYEKHKGKVNPFTLDLTGATLTGANVDAILSAALYTEISNGVLTLPAGALATATNGANNATLLTLREMGWQIA